MKIIAENWADLPPDLLHLILAKLSDISDISDICDYIQLRAVCKSWRCSISVSNLPRQFPWILNLDDNEGSLLEFYSFTSKKVYTMHAPNSSNKSLDLTSMLVRQFGCDDFFSLVRYKQSSQFREGYCTFLNPVNNSEVYLPVVHDPEPSGFRFCWSGPRSFYSEDCVIFSYGTNRLALCKSDGDKLDCIGGDLGYNYAFLNGLLFTIEYWKSGFTRVIDIGTHQEVYVIPPPKSEMRGIPFLVESSGEILLICYIHIYITAPNNYSWSSLCSALEDWELHNYYNNRIRRDEVHKFYIQRLEFGNREEKPSWVKVTSIGDQMLFIDFVAGRAFSLKASDFSGFNGNSIYFIDTQTSKICRYDMENGKTISVNCPLNGRKGLTWFVPTLKPCLSSMF